MKRKPKSEKDTKKIVNKNVKKTNKNTILNNKKIQYKNKFIKNKRKSAKGKYESLQNKNIESKDKNSKIEFQFLEEKKKMRKKLVALFIFIYVIFSIYTIISYLSWRNLAIPMMKNESSIIIDENENIIQKLGAEKKQENIKLSEIPQNLKNAYIDIEDERFYSHKGIDAKRTTAAIGSYVVNFGKSSFGGSTITQQLVKNLTGNNENSISRKVDEWVKSVELETFCSKEEILESYFNIIYVAPNTYGVNMGAKYYFNKDVRDLSLAECAFLAGINHAPNVYNPFNNNNNCDKIKKRTKTVLNKMLELKHIDNTQYEKAIKEVDNGLAFNNGSIQPESDGIYSYHTDALISELVSDISKKKNINKQFATNYVYMSGLTIYSTEKSDIQKILEEEYSKEEHILTSETGKKSQSAMVIINQSNGHVVACVGELGKKNTVRGFNRATQAVRQTGSAIKPLAVLAPGIDKRLFTASTIYNDEPTTFNYNSEIGYSPTNNENYIGQITVRRATESSQNIPFVKMIEIITPKTSIKYLEKMGITSLTEKDENLSLALGGLDKGVTPLEMAAAYATIANDGEYIEPTFYTKVNNSEGKTIIKTEQKETKVFSEEVAFILKQLLKQPVEGENGTAQICKIDGIDIAAKTGTTNENYDKWLCGFSNYYTAVTWYGYDISETINYTGKSPAALIWSKVMNNIHSNLNPTQFEMKGTVKQSQICAKTGNIANSNCEEIYIEYFLPGTLPSQCVSCNSRNKK